MVSVDISKGFNVASAAFQVDGTVRAQAIRCTAGITPHHPDSVTFRGKVGPHRLTSVVRPVSHGAVNTATATFTVT